MRLSLSSSCWALCRGKAVCRPTCPTSHIRRLHSSIRSNHPHNTAAMAAEANPNVFSMGPHTHKINRGSFHGPIRQGVVQRMQAALPKDQWGVIVIQGGTTLPVYSTDGEILFRQEAYMHYLTGVNEGEGSAIAIDVRTGRSILFIAKLPDSYGVWMGPIKPPDFYKQKYAVDEVAYLDDMGSVLQKLGAPHIHVLSGTNTDSGEQLPAVAFAGAGQLQQETDALLPVLNEARVHKTAAEVELVRYVNRLGSEAHVAMMRAAKPGMMEYQLESIFRHHTYMHGGCRNQGYTCIVASGSNGAVLHYGHAGAPNDRCMQDGDLALVDCGCEYYRYTSDITTTWPVNGKFTAAQAGIYNAVLDAHTSVLAAMRPGVLWTDMHTLAYRCILGGLKEMGLVKGSVDELLEADIGGLFMPHGLGHFLGVDTHDVGGYGPGFPARSTRPGYKSLRTARALEPGMLITVEPGCYFNPVLLQPAFEDPALARFLAKDAILPFMDFGGVRIEDNVLVTESGAESLTDVPRTVKDIEAVMAGAPWPVHAPKPADSA